jgi:HK97 family phage prohead protease
MDGSCELERRLIGEVPGLHVKQDDNGRTVIRGYAAVFESESQDLGGFVEIVERGAFDDVMRTNPDVFGKYNHERVIGRTTSGTMRLMVDDRGLRYEIDPPRSAADVIELIERGDVRGSSFAFRSSPKDEAWTRDANGRMIRRIKKFSFLGDAGPVDTPAYLATETYVSKRAIEMALAENTKAEEPANEQRADRPVVEDSAEPAPPEAETAPEDGTVEAGEEERAAVSLKPTAGMASAARRGLKLHEEGKSGDGLKPETVARANRLARREEMNDDWVREMNAWFARHDSASKSPGWDKAGEEKPGFVAWLLWGGNAAKNWSARKVKEMEGERDLPTIDEERDIDEESLEPQPITVVVSASTEDFRSKIASLKATMLRTHLHGK